MEIRLLGELEVWNDETPRRVSGAKLRALLALLALHRGAPVGPDLLIAGVWGDDLPANPLNALRIQIAQLRRTLGSDRVATSGAGYALVGVDVDIVRFERLVAEGRAHLAEGDAPAAAQSLRRALALLRGEPLAEFASSEFAVGERTRLEELRLSAVEARLQADLALGRHADVVGELETLCREHPLREPLWALRMTALYRAGRQADALRCFTEARHLLAEELGIAPGGELQRLEAMVLAQDPALDPVVPSSVASSPPRRGNLRAQLTSFVGRDDEVDELCARSRRARLVTLVGPGGVGKTRLAVEAAQRLGTESTDPVWLVELAGVSDAAGVGPAVARAIGVTDVSGGGSSPRSMSAVDAVVAQLLGASALLVLDNCEHVVAEVAGVVDTLLGSLPELRIVATSREILGVPGETLTHVGGLEIHAAVELFADRAAAVNERFVLDEGTRALVEEICARLDGLPLAIELAAARLRTLPLPQLASRLDDRFHFLTGGARTAMARQQTLKAVVDWSYDLLSGDEQRVFARLSVFGGGITVDAAEAVCGDASLPAEHVLDVLLRLVDKSLVEAAADASGEARFTLLQTLWQYGHDRLAESGDDDAVRTRHATHFKALAEAARDSRKWATGSRRRLSSELGNLRRALDWFVERGDAEAALALSVSSGWLFYTRAEFQEGARWVADALAVRGDAPSGEPPRGLGCLAHAWHGYFASFFAGPTAHLAECKAAADGLGTGDDPDLRADTLLLYASTLNRARQRRGALAVLEQVRPLLDELGDGWRLGLHGLIEALTLENSGRLDEAETAAHRSVGCFEAADDEWWVVEPLGILAGIAEHRGDLDRAASAYEAVVERSRTVGGEFFEPRWMSRLAGVRARQGNQAEADRLYRDTIAQGRNPLLTASALVAQASVARRLGDLPRARRLLEDGMARFELLGVAAGCAAALAGLAWWALAAGDPAGAASFAERARVTALRSGDPHTELVAESAVAAVAVVVDPSEQHRVQLGAIARRRGFSGGIYGAILDELDVAALADRYPPSPSAPMGR